MQTIQATQAQRRIIDTDQVLCNMEQLNSYNTHINGTVLRPESRLRRGRSKDEEPGQFATMAFAQCLCNRLVASTAFASSRRVAVRALSSPAEFEANPAPTPPTENLPTSLVSRTSQLDSLEGAAGIVKVNHYAILGVPVGASTSQIAQAFKARCEKVMDRKDQDEEASKAELRSLQIAFEVLTSEEERRVYDWALKRYENREGSYIWPYETDITQRYNPKEIPAVMRSFDEEGNQKVATFLLGWLVIAFLMSATMKTWIPYDLPY
ncbi:hypothetical protein R1flu_010867 [Riccia fluitans]|uniref:J domain-containing protein n=1 Tax=Riccia fluitans TaxID=41844 RepID=A0ABD1Z6Y4_9MARC